jgi:Tfp pilus assembly protein PilE
MKKTKDKGITLIALVITIIILLILAGISINAVIRRKWDNFKS